jgi:hypothetical protein
MVDLDLRSDAPSPAVGTVGPALAIDRTAKPARRSVSGGFVPTLVLPRARLEGALLTVGAPRYRWAAGMAETGAGECHRPLVSGGP